jgi:beta-lactamase regulating signal transducer with metallopeptidase domain
MNAFVLPSLQAAASALVASVWQGFVLAAMVWIGLRLAPRTSAGIRFLLWMSVFLIVAFLPFLSLKAAWGPVLHPDGAGAAPIFQLDSRWAFALAGIWLVASTMRAIGLAHNGLQLRKLWKRSTPVDCGAEVQAALSPVRFRRPQLCSSTEIDQPCVLGFFAPRILVPEWLLKKTTASDLEQIVLHEVAHLRRRDDWINLLQKAMLVIFPLNPVLFWIEKQMCAEREMACDESVVLATKAPRDYAACLVNLAGRRLEERQAKAAPASLSLGAWERRPELAGRIHTILRSGATLNPWKARTVMATLLLAALSGAVELGKSSQLVGFRSSSDEVMAASSVAMPPAQAPRAAYRDVVFREPVNASPIGMKSGVARHRKHPAALRPAASKLEHKVVDRSAIDAPAGQNFIMVTQWNNSAGRRTTITLIQTSFRIVADPAAQTLAGWYSFQL